MERSTMAIQQGAEYDSETYRGGGAVMGLGVTTLTQDREVIDGWVVASGPRGAATERLRRRRGNDLIVIPLLHWPL